jgi:hypothetical protein
MALDAGNTHAIAATLPIYSPGTIATFTLSQVNGKVIQEAIMVWNKSGAERVKSYRVYQELEAQYNDALQEIADLRTAVQLKDELIRRLAAEVAMLPKSSTVAQVEGLHESAADVYARSIPALKPPSGIRAVTRPGAYSSVDDGTAEEDVPGQRPDPLAHIPSPRKTLKHQSS